MCGPVLRTALVLVIPLSLLAQVSQAAPLFEQLFVEGQVLAGASTLPGFLLLDTVRHNGHRTISLSPKGNFVTVVNTDPSQGNAGFAGTFYQFGSATQGTLPKALRRESTISGQQQETFGSLGIDNSGNITYTATLVNPSAPPTRFASLWENDTMMFREGNAIPAGPLAGNFFGSISAAARSPSGTSSWISSYSTTSLGSTAGIALLRNTTGFDVLLKSGDTITGQGAIANESGAISANIRWSDAGTNHLTVVDLEIGFTDTDEIPVINGLPLTTGSGAIIREGAAIPALDGGLPGEIWDSFAEFDVNDAGDYIMGTFNDNVINDSVLMVNGVIQHRENDIVDGVTLAGQVQAVAINDLGDRAYVWNDTLFVNDQVVAGIGTLVDTNADGLGDTAISNQAVRKLEISNLPAAGGDLPIVYLGLEINCGLFPPMRTLMMTTTSTGGTFSFGSEALARAAPAVKETPTETAPSMRKIWPSGKPVMAYRCPAVP